MSQYAYCNHCDKEYVWDRNSQHVCKPADLADRIDNLEERADELEERILRLESSQ